MGKQVDLNELKNHKSGVYHSPTLDLRALSFDRLC